VDSQAAIQSIASNDGPASKNIQEIRKLIKLLGRLGKKIHIQWILSHIDLLGNNTADALAKKGTKLQGQHNNSFNIHTLTHLIKTKSEKKVYKELAQLLQGKQWTNIDKTWKNYYTKPRKEATTMFRLNTGHDCLATHLNKIKIYEIEECVLCKQQGSRMDCYHLPECTKLNSRLQQTRNLSGLYW
jgi:hypothetical protein